MKNRPLLSIAIGLSAVTAVLLMVWMVSLKGQIERASENFTELTHDVSEEVIALHNLQRYIGYGGFIHNLKNYVLRKDEAYFDRAMLNLVEANQELLKIELRVKGHGSTYDVSTIKSTLAEYQVKLLEAKALIAQGKSIEDVDSAIKVSDAGALESIDALTQFLLSNYQKANENYVGKLSDVHTLIGLGYLLFIPLIALGGIAYLLVSAMHKHTAEIDNTRKDLQSLLDTTPDSILSISQEGIIVRANASAKAFFGYDSELEGMNVDDLVPDSIKSEHGKMRQIFFDAPNTRMMGKGRRVQAKTKSGECRDVSVSLGHAYYNDMRFAIVCLRDVTAENRVKFQLQDFRQRVQLACDTGKLVFWYWDKHNGVIVSDKYDAKTQLLLAQEQSTLEQWLSDIHEDDRLTFTDALKHCETTKESITVYYRQESVTGGYKHIRTTMMPQTLEEMAQSVLAQEYSVRTVGMSLDISEQRKVESELLKAREDAEAANLAKSQFLANMSHEIRTPMNAITGIMTLLMEAELPERQAKLVRSAYSAGDSLVNIVDDILDFSKLEAGEVSVVNEPFSLDEVLDKLIDLYSVVAQSKSLILQLDVKPDVYISLVGDALRLGQILGNMVSNAIKFTPAGKVRIRVELTRANTTSCTLRFAVFDTGIGMNDAQKESIFKPFRQADNSTTREYGGTGLGLSICQRLLEMMNSNMSVNSVLGQGSEFYFEVEFLLQENANRYLDLMAEEKKALVVIEDSDIEDTVTQYFSHWGIKIACYNNNKRAYNVLEKNANEFDVLVIHHVDHERANRVLDICHLWREKKSGRMDSLIVITSQNNFNDKALRDLNPILILQPPTPSRLFDAVNSGKRDLIVSSGSSNMVHLSKEKTKPIVGAKVLLAEDVKTNQIVAVDFLQTLGLQVDVVENGAQAVEAVRDEDYDIVLMDFHMPVMNGLDATRKIREFMSIDELPIIAMTAAVFAQDRQAAIDCGMNAHLPKPIQIYQLASTLVDFIEQKRQRQDGEMANATSELAREPMVGHYIDFSVLDGCIDVETVRYNFNHNPVAYERCLNHFVNDFCEWANEIDALVQQQEFKKAAELAHKLKGAAANIYATSLATAASELQGMLAKGDTVALSKVKNLLAMLLHKLPLKSIDKKGA
ncbi:hybrid sensor histidine kinase/response regulator [Pseudoalteromonas pernae]|uniref:hybrid sensor histidine kinase/response regulator n=1 Tax=Pseudoalteromonas pernae TaxID=3118054 RepID=UPI003241C5AE